MSTRPSSRTTDLKPVIADLLRTCRPPPSLSLRLERILEDESTDSDNGQNSQREHVRKRRRTNRPRMYLGDGQYMIQALLHGCARDLLDDELFVEGVLLELQNFKVESADRLNGNGQVVYLAIEELEVVGATANAPLPQPIETESGLEEGGFLRESDELYEASGWADYAAAQETDRPDLRAAGLPMSPAVSVSSSPESDGFETAQVDILASLQRRQMLKRKHVEIQDSPPSPGLEPQDQPLYPRSAQLHLAQEPSNSRRHAIQPQRQPSGNGEEQAAASVPTPNLPPPQIHYTQPPPVAPLHTLASLLNPPTPLPARKYTCTVFGVISWISLSIIHKPPFPPKRLIKIHDPSIASRYAGITLAVFVDARTFLPKVGTVALFRGVTMQRWEGEVILNAYASLKDTDEAWFVDDAEVLGKQGFDVGKLEEWWKERVGRRTV